MENKKSGWIIDSECSHYMTIEVNNFFEFNSYDGTAIKVGNNAPFPIKGKGSITIKGKTNTEYVYFFDGLKHNLLSIGQLVDKGYQL